MSCRSITGEIKWVVRWERESPPTYKISKNILTPTSDDKLIDRARKYFWGRDLSGKFFLYGQERYLSESGIYYWQNRNGETVDVEI